MLDGLKVSLWFRSVIAEFGDKNSADEGHPQSQGDNDQFLLQGVHWDFEGRPGRAWGRRRGADQPRWSSSAASSTPRRSRRDFERCFYIGDRATRRPTATRSARYIEISPYTLEQIRYWMRQNFNFPNDVPIVIKEVPCVKEGCPPIETSIMAIEKNAPPRRVQDAEADQRDHVRPHLRPDREPDALLLSDFRLRVVHLRYRPSAWSGGAEGMGGRWLRRASAHRHAYIFSGSANTYIALWPRTGLTVLTTPSSPAVPD